MEKEMKEYFDKALKYSATVTRIAATGGSGAGKTTSTLELIDRFASQFIYSNIGAIQSSKIRTVIIPVCLKDSLEESVKKRAFFGIHFMEYSEIELVKNAFHNALSEKLRKAYRNYEDDDAEDIVRKTLAPENKMYDISAYCDADREDRLTEAVNKVCVSLIEGNEEFLPLNDVMKRKKARVEQQGKKFDLKEAFEQELVLRLASNLVDLDPVYKEVYGITDEMKRHICDTVQTFSNKGLEMEFDYEEKNAIYAYIDENENSCKLANELFSFMYKKDGKDLVVSHLTLIAEMSDEKPQADKTEEDKTEEDKTEHSYSVEEIFFKKYKFTPTKMPLYKIYDLKGLEAGKESIDETLIKLRESMPDAILAYHRTNDIKDYFVSYLNRIQTEFKKVPVTILLTHSDEVIRALWRNAKNAYGAPKEVKNGEPGFEEFEKFWKEQIVAAYNRLKEENKIFEKKTSKEETPNAPIFCSMVDECGDIDEILEKNEYELLYQKDRMADLIAGICKKQYELYEKAFCENEGEEANIRLKFNEEKLRNIVNKIVIGNKTHAASNYFNQKNLYPHWHTIYKWRAMHRGGSGWTSNAQVYDNISIYISNFVSGFINKAELAEAIEISIPDDFPLERAQNIRDTMKANILKDLDNNYRGFFYKLKQEMTYKAFEEEFNKTYFSSALELINKKLSDFDYVEGTMNDVLEDYADNFKALTFRCVLKKQANEQK